MEYEEVKVGMRVKINLDKNEECYSEEYDGREGKVDYIDVDEPEYSIEVNIEMLNGKIETGIMFKPSELEAVV